MRESLRQKNAEAPPRYNSSTSEAPPSYELNDLSAQVNVAAPEKAHTPPETAADPVPVHPTVDVERDTNVARSTQNTRPGKKPDSPRTFLGEMTLFLTIVSFLLWLLVVIKRNDFCGIEPPIYYGIPGGAFGLLVLFGSVVACTGACKRAPKQTGYRTGGFWLVWGVMAVIAGAGLVSARVWRCGRP